MAQDVLQTPIEYLKGVGPNRATLLRSELGIHTFQDLIHLFPNRYIDRTQFYKINALQRNNAEVQIMGQITDIKEVGQKRGKRLIATFRDETGKIDLVWFRGQKWIRERLKLHTDYVVFGKTNFFNGIFNMAHPDMELKTDFAKSLSTAIQPIYPSTEKLSNRGISNRVVCKLMEHLFLHVGTTFTESLSEELLEQNALISKKDALLNIHFPKSQKLLASAQFRLKFEELFFIQLQLVYKNLIHKSKIKGFPFEKVGHYFNDFYQHHLPFDLTDAQKRVVKEIRTDMGSNAQMNRLLQGDVGSGKTIVAFLSMLIAIDNEFQATLMAPTELLAIQHYNGLKPLCDAVGVTISLLTGSSKAVMRKEIHTGLEDGTLHILVGTHALLEDKVKFKNL